MGAEVAVIPQAGQPKSLIAAPAPSIDGSVLEMVLLQGDLSKLRPTDRVSYYRSVCESLGLNPLTRPFEYMALNGKLQLYAKKDCGDQLRQIHGVSVVVPSREIVEGCFVVTANASLPNGRVDSSIGVVPIDSLKGEARANAMMKAETKAKRRVTMSICGLAFLDETEVDAAGATRVKVDATTGEILSGTKEAAQAVAQQKIEALTKHDPAPTVIEAETIQELSPHDALRLAAERVVAKRKKPYDKTAHFDMLKEVGALKKRLLALAPDSEYRAILRSWGVEKSNQLPEDDGGVTAIACFKELQARVADLEAADAAAFDVLPNFAEWPDDPEAPALGLRIIVDGKRYRRADDLEPWKLVKQQ